MSSNNSNITPPPGSASARNGTPSSNQTSVGSSARELFGSGSKRQGLLQVKPSSAKRSKFNVGKSPNSKSNVPVNNVEGLDKHATCYLTGVVPTGVKQPICGLIVTPTGYFMDRHLSNIMYTRTSESVSTKTFLEATGACHRVVTVKTATGDELVKYSSKRDGKDPKPYPIKSIFIPMDPSILHSEAELKAYINDTFMPAFFNAINTTKNSKVQQDQLPLLKNMTQVRYVTNWSDAIVKQDDIGVLAKMTLAADGVSLVDWIDHEAGNLYTLFKRGEIQPDVACSLDIPFDVLDVADKNNLNRWNLEQSHKEDVHQLTLLNSRDNLDDVDLQLQESLQKRIDAYYKPHTSGVPKDVTVTNSNVPPTVLTDTGKSQGSEITESTVETTTKKKKASTKGGKGGKGKGKKTKEVVEIPLTQKSDTDDDVTSNDES